LTKQIQKTYSGHILIGEEGTRRENNRQSSYIWAIDPIDGTTAFVQGLPGWGIAIGLLYQGQPCFGLFYMPLLDDLTYTTGQGGVVCNGHKITATVCSDWGPKGFLAVDAGAHHNFYLNVKRIRALGSTGANLVYVARGTATATFNSKVRLWDVVAGAAILNQVGGTVQYLSGKPLDYLSLLDGQLAPEPIIAGHSEVLVGLKEVIRSR
jgi:myo-inositol-1(or 4)-monophosphatase